MQLQRGSLAGLLALSLALPATAAADFTEEFLENMLAAESARLASINSVRVVEESVGTRQLRYFEKASTTAGDGRTIHYLSYVSPAEIQRRNNPDDPISQATPGQLRGAAGMLEQQAPVAEAGVRQEIQESGFPPGLAAMLMNAGDDPRTPQDEDQPWLSANPTDTVSMYATMLRGAAAGREEEVRRKQQEKDEAAGRAEMAAAMRHIGRKTVDGRTAECFLASDLNYTQEDEDTTFRLDSVELCADAELYLPLRMTMQGEASEPGQAPRPVTIERHDRDYQNPAGCGNYYRPLRSVMRIGGTLSPEQERQMAEAQQQMAEFRKQLDAMPPAQKNMIMAQMGGRMEMMEKMAAGGGIEIETLTVEVRCNEPPPAPEEFARQLVR